MFCIHSNNKPLDIRKLLSTVDATIQFHGKTTALENTIRVFFNYLL